MGEKILVVDDNAEIVELLSIGLSNEGFSTIVAMTGNKAITLAKQEKPALILLDLILPDIDGIEVCKNLRENESTAQIPIIMVTSRSNMEDKILGLDEGADDYVQKPFELKELMARIRSLLRRSVILPLEKTEAEDLAHKFIESKGIAIDRERYFVKVEGRPIDLTKKEFELLYHLMKNAGKLVTRAYLYEKIWGYKEENPVTRAVDLHILRLRRKLGPLGDTVIETVQGRGYRFIE